jgi:hypothetical protein
MGLRRENAKPSEMMNGQLMVSGPLLTSLSFYLRYMIVLIDLDMRRGSDWIGYGLDIGCVQSISNLIQIIHG